MISKIWRVSAFKFLKITKILRELNGFQEFQHHLSDMHVDLFEIRYLFYELRLLNFQIHQF